MIVVNTSRFTTEQHKGAAGGPGVATLPSFNILQSLTFAAMPDDEVDKGVLSWMNIQLPGFEGVFPMPRAFFLTCEPGVAEPCYPAGADQPAFLPQKCPRRLGSRDASA